MIASENPGPKISKGSNLSVLNRILNKPVKKDSPGLSADSSDQMARTFFSVVWLSMLLIGLVCILTFGRNIPLAEDWLLVAPLTGNETDLPGWLWAQNNEHRIPLPKLVLLGLLKMTWSDFRAGMFFNIFILAALAYLMAVVASRLRGRASFADAFFPVALLHIGNWPNLVWGWQLSFVLPTVLTCAFFLIVIQSPDLSKALSAVTAGACAVMLPLCGANGILFVPFLSIWLGLCSRLNYRRGERHWISALLAGSAVLAVLISSIYFIGYIRPDWNPPSPGSVESLKTAAKFMALSLGPAAAGSWRLSSLVAFTFIFSGAILTVFGIFKKNTGTERLRAWSVFLFFCSLILFDLVIGWGRAGLVPTAGLPIRYVLLSVPVLCTVFFISELYGPAGYRGFLQMALLSVMLILLPLNMARGMQWGDWYSQGMDQIEKDVLAGDSQDVLAEKHRDFLIHWWDKDRLSSGMEMLRNQGTGIFSKMREDKTPLGNRAE
jgi:hypothetical protein